MSYIYKLDLSETVVPEDRREGQLRYALNKIGAKLSKERNWKPEYNKDGLPLDGPYHIQFSKCEVFKNLPLCHAEQLLLDRVQTSIDNLEKCRAPIRYNLHHSAEKYAERRATLIKYCSANNISIAAE